MLSCLAQVDIPANRTFSLVVISIMIFFTKFQAFSLHIQEIGQLDATVQERDFNTTQCIT